MFNMDRHPAEELYSEQLCTMNGEGYHSAPAAEGAEKHVLLIPTFDMHTEDLYKEQPVSYCLVVA